MPTPFVQLLNALIILLLPLVLVIGSVRLLVTDQYLAFEYSKADLSLDLFGFDQAQRLAYASANFRFVREAQPLEALSDTLIRLFPERFWFDAALTIAGLSLLGGLLLALIGWRWQPRRRAEPTRLHPSPSQP